MSERVFDNLIGDLFVAFAHDHVDRCLAADELRERRDHNRITELRADPDGFLERFGKFVFETDFP